MISIKLMGGLEELATGVQRRRASESGLGLSNSVGAFGAPLRGAPKSSLKTRSPRGAPRRGAPFTEEHPEGVPSVRASEHLGPPCGASEGPPKAAPEER